MLVVHLHIYGYASAALRAMGVVNADVGRRVGLLQKNVGWRDSTLDGCVPSWARDPLKLS